MDRIKMSPQKQKQPFLNNKDNFQCSSGKYNHKLKTGEKNVRIKDLHRDHKLLLTDFQESLNNWRNIPFVSEWEGECQFLTNPHTKLIKIQYRQDT